MIRRAVIAAFGLALLWTAMAAAETFPARSVKLIVPFAADVPFLLPQIKSGAIKAPAGVPADVLERLHRAAVAALNSDGLKKQYATFNATPAPVTPQQFAAFIMAEQAKWGPVVLKTGVKLE
mgnify:CR=1 FL=1